MRFVFFTILILLSNAGFSNTQEFTLENGLKIVVREDHRAPVVVSMIWYKVGSADEHGGNTGLSHALEHLMFKGTPQYPLGIFSKTIAGLGGQENAMTNNDYTAYYEKIASTHLAKSFAMEADRMQNLLLDSQEFAHEIKVIQEERRMRTDDNPQSLTFERFLAAAHLASPYHHPVIGWMNDLENMKVEDARAWYKKFYSPNNATLVVVGDVQPQEVFKLAKKYFGKIPAKAAITKKPQSEPVNLGKKSVQVHATAQLPFLLLGYTVPSVVTAPQNAQDPYALEVLAGILDAGDSARFSKHLVREQQIASTIDIYYNLYSRYQTQFIIYGTPSQGNTIEQFKNAIFKEIERVKTTLVSPEELQRVKTQIIAEKTFELDSIFGQAMELGLLETVGLGWKSADRYIEHINSVTPEQIQQVAKLYLNNDHITEAELIPESQPKR
jgi:zinc protease